MNDNNLKKMGMKIRSYVPDGHIGNTKLYSTF